MAALVARHLARVIAAGLTALVGASCDLGGDTNDDLLAGVTYSPTADRSFEDAIHVQHTGTPQRIALPGPPAAGDSASVDIAVRTRFERGGHVWSSGVDVAATDRVVDASDTGTVFETTIERRCAQGVGADRAAERWEDLLGTPLLRHVDETGRDTVGRGPEDATRVPLWAQDVLSADTIGVALPSESVGVGAVWTTIGFLHDEPLPSVLVTTRYDLVAFDDDHYEIALAQRQPIEWVVDGELLTGFLEANGTITGSRATRLDVQLDLERTIAVTRGAVDTVITTDIAIDSST